MPIVSIDNGNKRLTADDLADLDLERRWEALTNAMDADAREQVAHELAPCTHREFLARYLEVAQDDLIIG